MVKIAVPGGSGDVARVVIDALVATGKHEIVVLSRNDAPPPGKEVKGAAWAKVDYADKAALVEVLKGVHTVLSFTVNTDPANIVQKTLIDASVEAGVKRYAPSEWASSSFQALPWYHEKEVIREYLKEINKEKKVLEYSLFQPGLFLDYLAGPYVETLTPASSPIDYEHRRALLVEGAKVHDGRYTLTAVRDLAAVVARAVEYEGEWPVDGGIRGNVVTDEELVALGEKLRGPFAIEKLQLSDLQAGELKSSWVPLLQHPSIPPEMREAVSKPVTVGLLASKALGAWLASDSWNKLLPDLKFQEWREFTTGVWTGKP